MWASDFVSGLLPQPAPRRNPIAALAVISFCAYSAPMIKTPKNPQKNRQQPYGPEAMAAAQKRATEKQQRLAQALKANLARRKQQARARDGENPGHDDQIGG